MTRASQGSPDRVMSGLGGTGTGTIFAGGGLQVGPETTIGRVLLLISPATSVVAGSLLFYLHVSVNRWLEDREARRARMTLERALDNPQVPEVDKEEFRQLLVGFERDRITRELKRVGAVGTVPEPSRD
jgi:hypothetical protein